MLTLQNFRLKAPLRHLFKQAVSVQHWPAISLALCLLCLFVAMFATYQWWQAYALNQAYYNQSLANAPVALHEHQKAYHVAYLKTHRQQSEEALKAYMVAEASPDDQLRAKSKYAIGNHYFDMGIRASNIAAGGAHQQAVAYIELAREAYKGALRLQPEMHEAKFNLELLDRLSPEKRTQAWLAETDGVTLQPFKRNGTAMMRDNKRRGLP